MEANVPPLHFANVPVYWLRFHPAPGSTISCVNLYFNRAAAAALSPVLSPHRQGEVTPPRTIHSRVSFTATPRHTRALHLQCHLSWGGADIPGLFLQTSPHIFHCNLFRSIFFQWINIRLKQACSHPCSSLVCKLFSTLRLPNLAFLVHLPLIHVLRSMFHV